MVTIKTLEEFRRYYDSVMMPELTFLEEKRSALFQKMRIIDIFIISIVILLGGIIINYIPQCGCMYCFFGLTILVGSILANHYYHLNTSGYYAEFKKNVISKIVNFFDDKFNYIPSDFIHKEDFLSSKIFIDTPYPSRYRGDDLVTGEMGNAKIRFSEINASYTTGSGKQRDIHTIFKGLFFVAAFDKNFNDEIVMSISNVSNQSNYLSPNTLRGLEKFKNKKDIRISFIKNNMYITIPFWENLFEPKMSKSLLDFNEFAEYFECLNFSIATVEEMLANSGVWDSTEKPQMIQNSEPNTVYVNNLICPSCNVSVPSGSRFCIKCGNEL